MRFSTKIILGALTLSALGSVYYLDDYFSKQKEEKQLELSKALYFKPDDVIKFTLKNKHGKFVFSRDNSHAEWKMLEPQKINADQFLVTDTLSSAGQILVQQELSGKENSVAQNQTSLSQYGLNAPRITLSVTLGNAGERMLSLGSVVDIGTTMTGKLNSISSYGLSSVRDQLLVVDSSQISTLEDKRFEDFRTKRIGDFDGKEVEGIVLDSNANSVVLKKNREKWDMLSPDKIAGDKDFIETLIRNYQSLTADNVIEKEEVTRTGLQVYDLQSPAATMQFLGKEGRVLQKFMLGITKNGVYVRMPDGGVGKLNLSVWPEYVPKTAVFKERKVLSPEDVKNISALKLSPSLYYVKNNNEWTKQSSFTSPSTSAKPSIEALTFVSNFQFMTAEDVLVPKASDLKNFGFQAPLKQFSLLFTKRPTVEISIGRRVPFHEKSVYLKRSDSPLVYVVNADWLSQLAKLY